MTKTMKRISATLMTAIAAMTLALAFAATAFAGQTPYIIDKYDLIDQETQASMESYAESLSDEYGVGTYLYICADINNENVRDYAKAQWKKRDLGVGEDKSGIMFLIAVESRDYVTITHGSAIDNFTDYRINQIENDIVSYLKSDDWYNGCWIYLSDCYDTLKYKADNGEAIDGSGVNYTYDEEPAGPLMPLGIALVVALIVMFIVRGILKGQLKSVAAGSNASSYLIGAAQITSAHEDFLGTAITKTPIPKNDDHGGSSVDSGGFGGSGGGKF